MGYDTVDVVEDWMRTPSRHNLGIQCQTHQLLRLLFIILIKTSSDLRVNIRVNIRLNIRVKIRIRLRAKGYDKGKG